MDANSVMSPKVIEAATAIDHSKDSQSQVPYIVSILTVACFFSTAVVLLRLYTRIRILRTFGADDMMMGIAQVLTLGSATAIYFGMSRPALASGLKDVSLGTNAHPSLQKPLMDSADMSGC